MEERKRKQLSAHLQHQRIRAAQQVVICDRFCSVKAPFQAFPDRTYLPTRFCFGEKGITLVLRSFFFKIDK